MNKWLKFVHSCLLPATCLLCKKDAPADEMICLSCSDLFPAAVPRCKRCALPLTLSASSHCGQCIANPPPFIRCITPFGYADPVSGLIHKFKDSDNLAAGKFLSLTLAEKIIAEYSRAQLPDLILPVPLHPSRLRARGYNQSLEISRHLSRSLGINLQSRYLRCMRRTASQKGLSLSQRKLNLVDAYSIEEGALPSLKNTTVTLVDDVITTGSTASELSSLLLEHEVKGVHVWALARTDRH